jgi:hypothetical protein
MERYPRQVCEACQAKTTDAYGRRVDFVNVDLSGGFRGFYRENGAVYNQDLCYVDGRRCVAEEHRFGGIVVQAVV